MSTVCTFYAGDGISFLNLRFENDVKMYGTQTGRLAFGGEYLFENDVKMYGTQTIIFLKLKLIQFENDVKMYGTQTARNWKNSLTCLRMM